MNKLSLRVVMLMIAIMGTVNATLADDITVGDVSNTDCSWRTRTEGVIGHTILKLTRSDIGLVGELKDYHVNCGYDDVNVYCEEDGQNLTIVIDDGAGEHLADCTCPINIYFTLFNAMQDEFQLKVRGRSEKNVGAISLKGHTMVEIDLTTLVILYDEGFEYHLKMENFHASNITDDGNPKDVSQKLIISHDSETVFNCAYEKFVLPLDYSYLDVNLTLDDDSTLVINVLTDGIPDKNGKRTGGLYFNIVNTFRDAYHLQVNQTILLGSEDEQTTCLYDGDITVPLYDKVTIPLAPTSTGLYIEPLWYYADLFTQTASVQQSDTYKSLSNIAILPSIELWGTNCTVYKIVDSAFSNLTDLESITIPESVIEIGQEAFSGCTGLMSITIPEGVREIRDLTFRSCRGLTSVTFPDGLTSIGRRAFYDCRNLKEIDIPASVTFIDDDAFAFTQNLENVYCRATTPPYTNNSRQFRRGNTDATLHVPAASLQIYKETAPWRDFKYIVPLETEVAYRPFVEDGKVWKVGNTQTISDNSVNVVDYYYFDGDTINDGKACKQMMRQRFVSPEYSDDYWAPEPSLITVGAWYEENKKVYFYDENKQSMVIMYDFSLNDNESMALIDGYPPFIIGPKQTGGIEGFKGVYRDVMINQDIRSTTWLEGVGGIDGPTRNAYPETADPMPEFLMSCAVGDEVIYLNDEYEDGATPEGARKSRFDFTHTIKTKPKAPRRSKEELSIYGEYNDLQLGINLNPLYDAYLVRITNESGQVFYEKTINAGSIVALSIDISAYAKGRYTVTVENSSEYFTGEFEVQTAGIDAITINKEETNTVIYNLQGQRISSLQKGLNIVNGQKIYVK